MDSDSGWCREYVAANPSASKDTLAELCLDSNDFLVRYVVAGNPNTEPAVVLSLVDDVND